MTQSEWKRTFGDNLADILDFQGLTQSQFARDSGLSVSRINDYINGNATPTIFAIINMAYALDMDADEFLDFVDFGDRIE